MTDYLPKFKPGEAVTLQVPAPAAIIGGQMVNVDLTVSGADSTTFFGIASRDTPAGQLVGVYSEGVQYPIAAGAIARGAAVKCAANGQVTTWVPGTDAFERYVGIALEAASGAGVKFPVKFGR